MDIATNQPFSVATSMIPFLNHDDANRTLMGSNMQKQATPCLIQEAPIVATGVEGMAARDIGRNWQHGDIGTGGLDTRHGVAEARNPGHKTCWSLHHFALERIAFLG